MHSFLLRECRANHQSWIQNVKDGPPGKIRMTTTFPGS